MSRNHVRTNLLFARKFWGALSKSDTEALARLTDEHCLRVASGDLILLNGKWYVTHLGLLQVARRKKCHGIHVNMLRVSNPSKSRWVFKAIVYKSADCTGFVGYGDADPSNVSSVVRGAEMRVAETRAVNRALRKAYGIGICSVEELGASAEPAQFRAYASKLPPQPVNGNSGGPKLRDRLCQIIRQHQLDPNLVKSYAIAFCGVKTLREATREQVENFVGHLAGWAEKDRNALLCQLNSYLSPKEGAA
jgi:hypothetical protein